MELNKIYNEDCLIGMQRIPDGSVDLVVTSPPYNLGSTHHTGNNRFSPYKDDYPEEQYQQMQIQMLNELYRVLKEGGSVMYNHKNRIRDGKQITPYEWILQTPFTIKQEIVWLNGSQNFDKCRFYPMTERVYWLSKGTSTDFHNNINHHDYFDKSEWESVGTNAEHKRAFPLKFAQSMIFCFDNAKTILDPYMGSGTTAIACIREKRNFIGFELNKEYYEASIKRIKNEQSQLKLF